MTVGSMDQAESNEMRQRKWSRNNRLAAIIAERGLSTGGFRRSLRALVKECFPDDLIRKIQDDERQERPHDPTSTAEEIRGYEFLEWFGNSNCMPCAYKIDRDGTGSSVFDFTVEVYEVEGSKELDLWKLAYYGDLADRDGPNICLHILDKYDHEIVVPNEVLMGFAFIEDWEEKDRRNFLKAMRSRAIVQHHAPVSVDDGRSAEFKRDIRILKRQLVKTEHLQVAGCVQEIIYGLGLGDAHKSIAQRAGVHAAVVRSMGRLLKASHVDPKQIVSDTHAKWKAAHDALRELGIKLEENSDER